ncbi:MAG: chromate transporter [Lachnospiraceae bacterium]|nr:chromate transporter [Lachnospiraceae bacterium]
MIYVQLFLVFLQVGAFSFGGGYAAMPLICAQVVDQYGWLSEKDFADLVTISQMTPGPIAINAATFVGNQLAGIPGALVATIGVALPSCIFVTLLAVLYTKYKDLPVLKDALTALRPAVVSMILVAGLIILIPAIFRSGEVSFADGNFAIRPFVLFVGSVFALRKWKADPILVMVSCGVIELIAQCFLGL